MRKKGVNYNYAFTDQPGALIENIINMVLFFMFYV